MNDFPYPIPPKEEEEKKKNTTVSQNMKRPLMSQNQGFLFESTLKDTPPDRQTNLKSDITKKFLLSQTPISIYSISSRNSSSSSSSN